MPIFALDSVDGGGKSTASMLVRDYIDIDLKIKDVRLVNMPGATALGQELRRIVKSQQYDPAPIVERLIFAADTMQFEYEHGAFARDGGCVVCDRFSRITDLIYGPISGVDMNYLIELQDSIGERLVADIYFVFQLPSATAFERKMARETGTTLRDRCRIEEKGREFHEKIAAAYNSIEVNGGGMVSPLQKAIETRAKKIVLIDASQDSVGIFKQIKPHIDEVLIR